MALPTSADSAPTLALENQTRALLDELDIRLQSLDGKWESRVGALESQAVETAHSIADRAAVLRTDIEAHLTASDVATES
jgi:hypothetical protein